MRYRINEILSISNEKNVTNPWKDIENKIGFKFPLDYKIFIDSYGEGE